MNTVDELMKFVDEECKKHGWHYLIHVDEGENITGHYNVITNSKLHEFAKAINVLTDHYEETTLK